MNATLTIRDASRAGIHREVVGELMNTAIRNARMGAVLPAARAAQMALDTSAKWGDVIPDLRMSAETRARAEALVAAHRDACLEEVARRPWNPVEKPYRVTWTYAAAYPANWRDTQKVYATEAEARAAFDAPMGRARSVDLMVAVNPETWHRNGSWKSLAQRKNRNLRRAR